MTGKLTHSSASHARRRSRNHHHFVLTQSSPPLFFRISALLIKLMATCRKTMYWGGASTEKIEGSFMAHGVLPFRNVDCDLQQTEFTCDISPRL